MEPCSRCSGVSQATLIQYPGHSETAPSGDSGVSIPGKGVSCVRGARIKDERFGNGRSECWKQGLETDLEQLGLELKGGERAERAPTRGHLWVCLWVAGVRR